MLKTCPQAPIREVNTGTKTVKQDSLLLGYARVSTRNEEQATSVENQVKRLEEYGCSKVWADTYTGTEYDRPQFNELFEYAVQKTDLGKVQIVVSDSNRLGRGYDRVHLLQKLANQGISVRSLSEGVLSIDTPQEKLIAEVTAVVDGFQAADTRDKVRRSKAEARSQRKPLGNRAPLGYRWSNDKTKFEIDPETSPVVLELVDKFLSGMGQLTLAKWLEKTHGIERCPTGIYGLLKNPVLRGHLRYRWKENGEKREEIAPNTHEPLITPDQDRAIALRFKLNKAHPPKKKHQPIYAVSGLLYCQDCKRKLHRANVRGYINFRCRGMPWQRRGCPNSGVIAANRPEPEILKAICDYAEDLARAVLQPDNPIEDPRLIQLQAELTDLQSIQNRNFRDATQRAIDEIQRDIALIRNQERESEAFKADQAETIKALADPDFWEGLSEPERNTIYRDLGIRVWCKGRDIVSVDIGG